MPYFSRSATLNGLADVVSALGGDARVLAQEIGLPVAALYQPDLRIKTAHAIALFELTATRMRAADIGLRIAEARKFSALGVVELVMREQATVRNAMTTLAKNIWAHVEGISLEIEVSEELAILSPVIQRAAHTPSRQANELAVGVLARLLKRFLGSSWKPQMVVFSHERPKDIARHVKFFGLSPIFSQDRNAVVLRDFELDTPIVGTDPGMAAQLATYLEYVAGTRNESYATRVRECVSMLLPTGTCNIDVVAQRFAVNRRTLHRKLAAEGTTFEAIVREQRMELADAYINAKEYSLTEIAGLLGFSCLSAFSRWRRMNGAVRQ